ncbi:MAG: hypothetical protein WC833_04500 [Bacteroidales bacterium]|jgi:hypothetical protein
MKNLTFKGMFTSIGILMIVCFVLVSCNKNHQEVIFENNVDKMVELANQQYLNTLIISGSETSTFIAQNDGLTAVYMANERGFQSNATEALNPLTSCLKSVQLTREQALQVRKTLIIFETRNAGIISTHREAYAKIQAKMEAARIELLKQATSVRMNRQELSKKLENLKAQFEQALKELKEKNAEIFSISYRELMLSLGKILDERQWGAFTKCLSQ